MKICAMKSVILIILVCLLLAFGCVSQNEVSTLDNRLSELEIRNAENRKTRETIETGLQAREQEEQQLRQQSASLRAKVSALNEEIRILTGRIEALEHLLQRQKRQGSDSLQAEKTRIERLSKTSKANDERIYRIEQYLNFESSAPTAAKEKSVAKIIPAGQVKPKNAEEDIYRLAKQAFDQGDSDTARKKFQELIERFPKSERADNAQFWIGEIYYREKWFEKSILEYQKVIENYPKGNKVPASLLKQGLAFLNLGDKANSRLILQELIKKHPKSNEAKIAKDKLKALK